MSRSATDVDRRALVGSALALALLPLSARSQETTEIAQFGDVIDVGGVPSGEWLKVLVDAKPVYVRHRTAGEIASARADDAAVMPDPARDSDRAPDAEWLTVSGVCTHAACIASCGLGPYRGFSCFCHGSIYDVSGRVRRGPAKKNLAVVRHKRVGNQIVLLG
jgi:ubiquinol-cytochrome c reductase iron-sulfur subunit